MKAFIVGVKGRPPSKPIPKRDAATALLLGRIPVPGARGYEYKKRGQDIWRKAKGKPALKAGISGIRLRLGDAVWVRKAGTPVLYQLRAVDVVERIPDYPYVVGTRGVRTLWTDIQAAVNDLGPGHRFVCQGVCNCRRIDGSSTWSQHAMGVPCGNAIDGHIVNGSGDFDRVATSTVVNKIRAAGHAAETLWQVSGHYDHFHFTAEPKLFGWPPCA